MSGYVLKPLAKADIFNIWAYIAGHNPSGAFSNNASDAFKVSHGLFANE